jgi:hypothetical protein
MKSIVAKSRQTGLAIILVGLMVMIIGLGQYFESKLKVATLIQNNIGSFKKYEVLEGLVTYSLPEGWIASEGSTSKENVKYFNEFISEDANIRGFIQVIQGKEDLKKLINSDIEEVKDMGIKDYTLEQRLVKGHNAKIIKYNIGSSENNISKGYNYYISNEGCIVKINFLMKDKTHKENTQVFLENIVNTISFK